MLAARAGHVVLVLAAVLAVAYLARAVARFLRQPGVVLEVAVGLFIGPVIVAIGGAPLLNALLPAEVTVWVRLVGHVGLVLFLMGVANELRVTPDRGNRRAIGWSSAGGFLVPLVSGAVFAVWVLTSGDASLRGTAPMPALVLLLTVSLAVTAVPVLARILADDGLTDTRVGRLAMTVAVIIDTASWLLVALAIGLAADGSGGVPRLSGVLVAGILAMFGTRRLLNSDLAFGWCARFPRGTVLVLVGIGLAAFATMESWGLTGVFGAVLVGFAIPNDGENGAWHRVVRVVLRGGRHLIPVFFVVTGITVFANGVGPMSWLAIAVATGLAVFGKVAGGYVGARMGGQSHWDGLRMGVLLNARGLTELVVLQAGYLAGILTSTMFLALVVMALVTTAMTMPVYALVERSAHRRQLKQPAPAGGELP
jgi:Kef-type K+ transport system membrane component KefB